MYGLQHGALAIKGPKITSVKPFKQENQRSNPYKIKKKRKTRINYINKRQLLYIRFLSESELLFPNPNYCFLSESELLFPNPNYCFLIRIIVSYLNPNYCFLIRIIV